MGFFDLVDEHKPAIRAADQVMILPKTATAIPELAITAAENVTTESNQPRWRPVSISLFLQQHGNGKPENFNSALPWLMRNLPALLTAGWTRPGLFQRSRNNYPAGRWGVAWLNVWNRPGVTIILHSSGKLAFSFSSGGREITQTAYPPAWQLMTPKWPG